MANALAYYSKLYSIGPLNPLKGQNKECILIKGKYLRRTISKAFKETLRDGNESFCQFAVVRTGKIPNLPHSETKLQSRLQTFT
jgi:hypothetical protein